MARREQLTMGVLGGPRAMADQNLAPAQVKQAAAAGSELLPT